MEISISITVPLFGLSLTAEIDGQYTHDTFAPESVYLGTISYTTERSQLDCGLGMFLPTPADMSDFYSTHAEAIDAAVAAELADHKVSLYTGKTVTTLDRVKRKVIASDGTEAPYDRLLIATGSTPFILPALFTKSK